MQSGRDWKHNPHCAPGGIQTRVLEVEGEARHHYTNLPVGSGVLGSSIKYWECIYGGLDTLNYLFLFIYFLKTSKNGEDKNTSNIQYNTRDINT